MKTMTMQSNIFKINSPKYTDDIFLDTFSSINVTPSVNSGAAPNPCRSWATKNNQTFHDTFSLSTWSGSVEHSLKKNNILYMQGTLQFSQKHNLLDFQATTHIHQSASLKSWWHKIYRAFIPWLLFFIILTWSDLVLFPSTNVEHVVVTVSEARYGPTRKCGRANVNEPRPIRTTPHPSHNILDAPALPP